MVPILNGVLGKEGRGAACVGVSMHIFYLVVPLDFRDLRFGLFFG